MPVAQFPPRKFVQRLIGEGLRVRGPVARVPLNNYMCANPRYGGNRNAEQLWVAVREVTRNTMDGQVLDGFGHEEVVRLQNGQGKPEIIEQLMDVVWRRRVELRAWRQRRETPLAAYFRGGDAAPDWQRMIDDRRFGLDCIGFVGRYLEAAGVSAYRSWTPSQYVGGLPFVQRLEDVEPCTVIAWADGGHVAVVDRVVELGGGRGGRYIVADICQSTVGSGLEARGPQLNRGVRIAEAGDAAWVDFDETRSATRAITQGEHRQPTREERAAITAQATHGGPEGFHGGRLYRLSGGTPTCAVQGPVYLLGHRHLTRAWTEPPPRRAGGA